tara:strand:- start:1750 stop:2646 length:897 start_codon:yes stop_codon:yes gene_type:complete
MKQVSRTSEKWNEMPFAGTTRNGNDFLEEIMMVKKVAIGGGVALLVVLLLFGRSTFSYLSTTVSRVHDSVKSAVPVDFELDRARKETSRITPEVRKNMHLIATEEHEIEKLEKRINVLEEKLSQGEKHILRLKSDLESGTLNLSYGGISYTAKEVKQDLESRFGEYTTDAETLKSLVQLLQTRNNALHNAQERLTEMQASQRAMTVEIENLEARNALLTVYKSSNEDSFEDSQLAHTRDLLDKIESRIGIDEKMQAAESRSMDRIPLESVDAEVDVLDRISEYFESAEEVVEIELASN